MGNLLKILVHEANLSESQGGRWLLEQLGNAYSRLRHLWADQGYKPAFVKWVQSHLGWTVEIVKPPYRPRGDTAQATRELLGADEFARRFPTGFRVLPRRWVVERTLAWLNKQRRLSKDYEFLSETTEAWCYLTMSRIMLRRLSVSTA